MDDMTNRAIQASDIFSDYLAQEIKKNNANIKTAEQLEQEKLDIINNFEEFQNKVNSSLKLKETFKKLQQLFLTNEKYASTVDPLFVESTLLLKLD